MFRRMYHVSSTYYSFKKQGIKLSKMVFTKRNRKWHGPDYIYESNSLSNVKRLSKTSNEPGKRGIRRLAMLNKVFMKYITDIMSTGSIAVNIVGRGIEISKVKVSNDFDFIHVYWVCKGNTSDVETEAVLNKIAGPLRHELSVLRVMGEVPYIVFVKDLQEATIADMDRRLQTADCGEDYIQTDPGHFLKSEFTLNTKLSAEVKAKIKCLEDEGPINETPLPEMTQTVYGLDHEKILNRLLVNRKKNIDAWGNLMAENPIISYRKADYENKDINTDHNSKQVADFLLKQRQLQRRKANRDTASVTSTAVYTSGDDDDYDDGEWEEDKYEEDDEFDNSDVNRPNPPV